jgi:endoglycosylceramidase
LPAPDRSLKIKAMIRKIARAAWIALGCAAFAPMPSGAEVFTVRDGFIRDDAGRAVIFRGVNLSERHKRAPYLDFHQSGDFARVRSDWGMNSVRLLISWAAIEPERGRIDRAYLDEVARRLDWARDAGLSVVLDMHQDIYGVGFARGGGNGAPAWTCDSWLYKIFKPTSPWFFNYLTFPVARCLGGFWGRDDTLRAHMIEAWREVARRFSRHPAVAGFDPMNEPFWYALFTFEKNKLQPFYDRIVAAVRHEAPHWLAFLEPAASRNFGVATRLVPRRHENVVYSPHSYDIAAESGNGFDARRASQLLSQARTLAREARKLGAALWIGEYGGMPAKRGIAAYMNAQYAAFGAVAAGSMYWNYTRDESYGMLHEDGREKAALLAALVRPYPERIPGTPRSYSFDPDSRVFELRFDPVAGVPAPAVISVPERVYPNGYAVECGACSYRKEAGRLLVWGSQGVIALRP